MITDFFEYIKEIDFNIISTEYYINYHKLDNNDVESYNFVSKNNTKYSVYFMITKEDNVLLSDKTYLKQHGNIDEIPTIFFSLTERNFDDNFDDITNNNEMLEVMGKVVYLIKEYINKHNYDIYSIGTTDDKKIKFYNHYRKYFKDYNILIGNSKYYFDNFNNNTDVFYLVKNNTLNIKKLKLSENCFLKM